MKRKGPHTPPSEMVFEAISFLKEKDGSSFKAIKKYIATNYNIDIEKAGPHIQKFLKVAVKDGYLIQTKGKIGKANGLFKLCTVKKEKSKSSASSNRKKKSKQRVINEEKETVVKERKSLKKKVKSSKKKFNNDKIELKKMKDKSTTKKQDIKESKNTLKANEKSKTKATFAGNKHTSKQDNFVKRNKCAVVNNTTKPSDLRKNLSRKVQKDAAHNNIKPSKVTLGDFLITIEAKVHHIQPNSPKKKTSRIRRQHLNKKNI